MAAYSENCFDLRHCVPMEPGEETRCATEYVKTRAPMLAKRLVTANLRLVVAIAKDYRRDHYDTRDLVQEGNLGLMHAVERYDPSRGVKLSTYAAWWIRAYILKYTITNWRLVKTGTTQVQRKLFFNLQRERRKLESSGVQPDAKQLAAALDVREEDVVTMLERFLGVDTSLETPRNAGEAESRTVGDSLRAESTWQPDVRVEAYEFDDLLQTKLATFGRALCGRELTIFRRRLLSEDPVTLSQLAVAFGVTRERVRQLEERLKVRIRDYLTKEMGAAIDPTKIAVTVRAKPAPIPARTRLEESAYARVAEARNAAVMLPRWLPTEASAR